MVALHQGLAEMDYVEGRNVVFEYHWAHEHYDDLPAMAAELVHLKVTMLVAATLPSVLAAKATTTKPIVLFGGGDPVEQGLVASFNRPGGNLTGACVFINDPGPKQLELLHEAALKVSPIGFLSNPDNPKEAQQNRGMQDAPGLWVAASKVGFVDDCSWSKPFDSDQGLDVSVAIPGP